MEKGNEHARLNERKWDLRAKTFDDRRFDYFRFMQKRVVSLVGLKENQHFLDLGCGTGWAVRYAASLVNQRGEFYGIDISSKMIEKAKARSKGYENAHFYKSNAEELPFEGSFFDFIICTNSFHHYLNPSQALGEAHRVLKSGGKIYILDITTDGPIMKMIDKWIKRKEREHVKYYSTRDYRMLFATAKLKHITSKLITFPLKVHMAEK